MKVYIPVREPLSYPLRTQMVVDAQREAAKQIEYPRFVGVERIYALTNYTHHIIFEGEELSCFAPVED